MVSPIRGGGGRGGLLLSQLQLRCRCGDWQVGELQGHARRLDGRWTGKERRSNAGGPGAGGPTVSAPERPSCLVTYRATRSGAHSDTGPSCSALFRASSTPRDEQEGYQHAGGQYSHISWREHRTLRGEARAGAIKGGNGQSMARGVSPL